MRRTGLLPLLTLLLVPPAAGQEFGESESHVDLSGSYSGSGSAPALHLLQGEKDLLVSFSWSWGQGKSRICYCLGRAERKGPASWSFQAPLEGTVDIARGKMRVALKKPACCSDGFPGLPIYALSTRLAPRSCVLATQQAYLLDVDGNTTGNEAIKGDKLEVVVAPDDRSDLVVVRFGKSRKLGLLRATDVECGR